MSDKKLSYRNLNIAYDRPKGGNLDKTLPYDPPKGSEQPNPQPPPAEKRSGERV